MRPKLSDEAMKIIGSMYTRMGGVVEIKVKKVIFNDPVTVIYWTDDTKTVVRCQHGDTFNPLIGFLMAFMKKSCGNKGNYNELLKQYVPSYGRAEQ